MHRRVPFKKKIIERKEAEEEGGETTGKGELRPPRAETRPNKRHSISFL